MLEISAVKQSGIIDDLKFENFLMLVPDDEKARIKKKLQPADRQRALIAGILTRSVICERLEVKNSQIVFEKNEHGKPYLKNQSGRGLSMPLSKFSIAMNAKGIFLRDPAQDGNFSFRQYRVDPDYKLSVCVQGEIKEGKLTTQTIEEVALNLSRL